MGRQKRRHSVNATETSTDEINKDVVVLDGYSTVDNTTTLDKDPIIYNKPVPRFSNKPTDNPFAGLPTTVRPIPRLPTPITTVPSSPPWSLDPFEESNSFKNTENFILNIKPDYKRYIWRPTNSTKTMYTMFHKYDNNKLRAQKILIPGCLGVYVDLQAPSSYKKWQVKLLSDGEITDRINELLALGPGFQQPTDVLGLTTALKVNDEELRDRLDISTTGPFPFLYDGSSTSTEYMKHQLPASQFTTNTQVIVECIFTAYNIKGNSGYSFKMLSLIKTSPSIPATIDEDNDNFVVDSTPLLPKKRSAEEIQTKAKKHRFDKLLEKRGEDEIESEGKTSH